MSVDARIEEYQEVELFGKPALFTNSRIERNTVPDGWFCYDLRGSDYDPGRPVTIEPHVVVNHAGSILTHEPVKFRNEQTSRRLRDGLNFTGDIISLADFCEDHELAYPTDTSKYMLRPASPEDAGLFYAHSLDEEKALGCIGNVRIDFGHRGQEFWHTWWPSYDTALNTPEFKAELQELVDELRNGVLKNLSGMNSYCYEHGGKIDGGYQQNYGYVAETGIDDIGTFHCAWDNGRGLGLVLGEDRFSILPPETRLLKLYMPMTVDYFERTEWGDMENEPTEMSSREAVEYVDSISAALLRERMPEEAERGLMEYVYK